MGSDGGKFDVSDRLTADRLNRKMVLVDAGANIAAVAPSPGMLAFCTSAGSGFTAGVLYRRNTANSAWDQIIDNNGAQELQNKSMSGTQNAFSAIPYTSLVLSNGIINADINASAAIVRSKLAIGSPQHGTGRITTSGSGEYDVVATITPSSYPALVLATAGLSAQVTDNSGFGLKN